MVYIELNRISLGINGNRIFNVVHYGYEPDACINTDNVMTFITKNVWLINRMSYNMQH